MNEQEVREYLEDGQKVDKINFLSTNDPGDHINRLLLSPENFDRLSDYMKGKKLLDKINDPLSRVKLTNSDYAFSADDIDRVVDLGEAGRWTVQLSVSVKRVT